MDLSDLHKVRSKRLVQIAKDFNVNISNCKTKEEIIQAMINHRHELQKYKDFTYLKQMGHKGKDGTAFLAIHNKSKKEVVVKIFHKKSRARIQKEVAMQMTAAEHNLSPAIVGWSAEGNYVAMEKLDTTLFDLFQKQKNTLTTKQQKDVVQLCEKMDDCGVFHADPNPLNFMYKQNKLYLVDFGFSVYMNNACISKYGKKPNSKYMILGLIKHLRDFNDKCRLKVFTQYLFKNQYLHGTL